MILTDLKNLRRYECLNKHFAALIYNRKNEMCRVGKRNAMVLVENEM